MDLVRVFRSDGAAPRTIHIKGTPAEPLFPANQVGDLLGCTNIQAMLEDFDDDIVILAR